MAGRALNQFSDSAKSRVSPDLEETAKQLVVVISWVTHVHYCTPKSLPSPLNLKVINACSRIRVARQPPGGLPGATKQKQHHLVDLESSVDSLQQGLLSWMELDQSKAHGATPPIHPGSSDFG